MREVIKNRKLLIDADGIIYKYAAGLEEEFEWSEDGAGYITLTTDSHEIFRLVKTECRKLAREYDAEPVICITDSAKNFRFDFFPEYKGNRVHTRKPLGIKWVRDRLQDMPETMFRPRLEADDIIGVLSTWRKYLKDNYPIVWSPDKDMKTIPGAHIGKDGTEYTITPDMAWEFFLMQCIAGDTSDGVPGAPGFGPKTAIEYLDEYGYTWDTVKMAYSESWTPVSTALTYARAVRILHASEYDFKRQEAILWTP
jgi:DNA polymerase-1